MTHIRWYAGRDRKHRGRFFAEVQWYEGNHQESIRAVNEDSVPTAVLAVMEERRCLRQHPERHCHGEDA